MGPRGYPTKGMYVAEKRTTSMARTRFMCEKKPMVQLGYNPAKLPLP